MRGARAAPRQGLSPDGRRRDWLVMTAASSVERLRARTRLEPGPKGTHETLLPSMPKWVIPFPRYERQIPHANTQPLPIVQCSSFDGHQHILREQCDGDETRSGHWCDSCIICKMKTAFLLMAQYNGKAIIPINDVCRDYFPHLTPTKLVQKISAGEIAIPLVRIENSQKSAKGVHLADLAEYLDARAEAARKEMTALTR
jgi:hypothetical protein